MASEKIDSILSKKVFDDFTRLNKEIEGAVIKLEKMAAILGGGADKTTVGEMQKTLNDYAKAKERLSVLETNANKQLIEASRLLKERNAQLKNQNTLTSESTGTIQKLTAANALLRAEQQRLNLATKEGIARNKEINKTIDDNANRIKQYSSAVDKQRMNIGNYSSALSGVVGSLAPIAIAAKVAMLAIDYLKKSLQNFIAFEKQMASLRAITGATADEMKRYKQAAFEMSTGTTQGATEILKAIQMVGNQSPALLKTQESLLGVTKASIVLSEASGGLISVAESANAVTAAMNVFGLAGTDAMKIVNTLAAAEQQGSASTQDLTESFQKVGPIAKLANISFEETAALLETMAKGNIKAEQAGNSLKGMIVNLKDAGLGYKSGIFNINDALAEFKQKTDSITDAKKKDAYITDVLKKENQAGALVIMDNIELYNNLKKGITDTTTAVEQQAIMNETLAAKTKMADNAWENLSITMAEGNTGLSAAAKLWQELKIAIAGGIVAAQQGDEIVAKSLNANTFQKLFGAFKGEYKDIGAKAAGELSVAGDMSNKILLETIQNYKLLREEAAWGENADEKKVAIYDEIVKRFKDIAKQRIEAAKAANDEKTADDKKVTTGGAGSVKASVVIEETAMQKFREKIKLQEAAMIGRINKEIEDDTKAHGDKMKYITERYYNTALQTIENEKNRINEKYDSEITAANEAFTKGEISYVKYQKTLVDIKKKSDDELFNSTLVLLQREANLYADGSNERIAIEAKIAEAKKNYSNEAAQVEIDNQARIKEAKMSVLNEVSSAIGEIVKNGSDERIAQYDEEQKASDEKYKNELEAAEGNEALQKQIRDRQDNDRKIIDDKKKREQIKQAEFERNWALVQVAIKTAVAIAEHSSLPPPANIVMMAADVVIGAAQAAAISSRPIPKYFKGTDHAQQGLAWVGEEGSELMTMRDGREVLTPNKPTLTYLQGGEKIKTAPITKQILSARLKEKSSNLVENRMMDFASKEIVNAIKNKEFASINVTERGIEKMALRGVSRTKYINGLVSSKL